MIRHILFDADNTLFDFDAMEKNAFFDTLGVFSLPCDDALYTRYSALNRKLWLEFEKGRADKEQALAERFEWLLTGTGISGADMNRVFQMNLAGHSALMPGALELCEALSRRFTLSIVTNSVGLTQRRKLSNSPLGPYFPRQFISEEIGYSKPDIHFFTHVMNALGNPDPAHVLIVGDSLTSDIQGGINAGLKTCWLNPERMPVPDGYAIDYVITGLRELEGLLE